MADFLETRDELRQHRETHDQLQLAAAAFAYRLRTLEQRLADLQRQSGPNYPVYIKRAADLKQQISAAKEQAAASQEQFKAARHKLIQAEKSFDLFIDPRTQLQDHFSNQTPFLLFPLRMETRFKNTNNQTQLWVRVYPDECMVDSFEPLLSKKEVNNAARFWAEYYSAGKPADLSNPEPQIVDLQKAAWRLIVSAHGSGRAAWITQQLVPDEVASIFPVRGAKTVILAIATDSWNPANQGSITGLFRQLWLANGNDALTKKAKQDFTDANPGMDPDSIMALYQPVNFDEPLPAGLKREEADLKFAIAVFPDVEKKSEKEHSWSRPSRVNIFPERLALIRFKNGLPAEPVFGKTIPYPLPTSPDPSPDADKQFEQTPDGDMIFADAVKWVADFDRAVETGMGFRLNLAPDELNGFERLLVLGVKIGADKSEGKKQLETLFDHHFFTKKGLRLVPQGTPTNNTESSDSGFTWKENPDETFEQYFNKKDGFSHEPKRGLRADGQWLAEWLGINENIFKKVLNSGGSDQRDAINMNVALWPATMGYMLGSLMHFAIEPETVDKARNFFNDNVRGRGPIPAIRIGNQPYGILPATAFKRLQWVDAVSNNGGLVIVENEARQFIKDLYVLLLRIDDHWNKNLLSSVSHIAQPSADVYKTLLDILSLHPTSAEFHRRYLESLIEISNTVSIVKPAFHLHKDIVINAMNFMRNTLGYSKDGSTPQIAALMAHPNVYPVKHLVDDVPPSETVGIGDYTADQKNYIAALTRAARKSEDAVRTGDGLTRHPDTELYRLLKFALESGYHASGINVVASKKVSDKTGLSALRSEQPFMHQEFKNTFTESRYALLYKTIPEISPVKTVSEFIRDSLFEVNIPLFSSYLSSQLKALDALENVPTARLERAFIEHLDCCSYRLDAWKTGIITQQLQYMRGNADGVGNGQSRPGIFLGAFGWLENVRPDKNKTVSVTQLPEDVKDDFDPGNNKVYLTDSSNEGYIHAPSLNQGVTAAVLRNGYISHGKPDGNNVLAVNLSSERVRLALSVIEGIQGGQSLAALLGYHFERTLHDRDDLKAKGIDAFIYPVRKQFPLVADKLKDTAVKNNADPSVDADTVPITAIEARNVVHGINLANHVKKQTGANKNYPFGLPLVHSDPLINEAITDAVNEIIDIADAVADLGMAESVHHIVMGNADRAAGVLESYSKGGYPPEPDVIRTPRSGATLTHRVAVPFTYIDNVLAGSPRAKAEPSVNKWLATMLPPLNAIVCNCTYTSRADGLQKNIDVSLQDIGFEPIDVLYALHAFGKHALNELDDRLFFYLNATKDPLLGENISLNYTQGSSSPAAITVFQIMPLVKSLRSIVVESAPLGPTDLALPNEASKKDMPPPELPVQRAADVRGSLVTAIANAKVAGGIISELTKLPPAATATEAQLAAIRTNIDATIDRFAALLLELGTYGIQQTGIGSFYTQKQQWYTALKNKVQELIDRWVKKLSDYASLAAQSHDAGTLQKMERLVSTTGTPLSLITFAGVETKKHSFTTRLSNIQVIAGKNYAKLADLVQDILSLHTAAFDLVSIDLTDQFRQVILFIYDLQARAKALLSDLETRRIPAVDTILGTIPTLDPVNGAKQVEAAVHIILGSDFKMVPRYALPDDPKTEIANSWNSTGTLLHYLVTDGKRANPTEDWLHGMARVHEKMKHLENIILMREAFDMNEDKFTIHPVQLPFKTEKYHWLAMPFKQEDIDLEKGNTLLYTAFTNAAAASPAEICGMRVDEWTEIIPAKEETTGIAFQYNRPNSEAPQTMLLVTPTRLTGNWQWGDLVDALSYALDAAKSRAIEPDWIAPTPYASFLPAVIGPESFHPYSIVLDNKAHYTVEKTNTIIH